MSYVVNFRHHSKFVNNQSNETLSFYLSVNQDCLDISLIGFKKNRMTVTAKVFVIKTGDEFKSVKETVRSCNRLKVAFITTHSSAPSMNTTLTLKV